MKKLVLITCVAFLFTIFGGTSMGFNEPNGKEPFESIFFMAAHLEKFLDDPMHFSENWGNNDELYFQLRDFELIYPQVNSQGDIVSAYNRDLNDADYELIMSIDKINVLLTQQNISDQVNDSIVFSEGYLGHYIIFARNDKNCYFIPLLAGLSEYRELENHKVYTLSEFRKICLDREYRFIMFGEEISSPVKAFGKLDTVFIPLRAYLEKRGFEVIWKEDRTIHIQDGEDEYVLALGPEWKGELKAWRNGEDLTWEFQESPWYIIKNGCTMLPTLSFFPSFEYYSNQLEPQLEAETIVDYDNGFVETRIRDRRNDN